MKKWNYYNDSDPKVCAWARELIRRKLVPDGEVDGRSICDVQPTDLSGYAQCHFFCGILGWSYALRLAGWPDTRPVWTGSCPCQPFSFAGKAGGVGDERHLWPAFRTLIAECRPAIAFGEQVASADGRLWLAGVRADLENLGYAVGAADLCAAGVGAPHIRQRLYWVADRVCAERWPQHEHDEDGRHREDDGRQEARIIPGARGTVCGLADAQVGGLGADGSAPRDGGHADERGEAGGVGNAEQCGCRREPRRRTGGQPADTTGGLGDSVREGRGDGGRAESGEYPITGNWEVCDWLPCFDGKARRIEPGIAALAHGVPARVVRLRGYGNAIVAPLAAEFVRAATEAIGGGQ